MGVDPSTVAVRLDKWLWAARFFKTRTLASEAIAGGKVHLDGHRTKPGKGVRAGARLRIRKGVEEFEIVVLGLSRQRRPAKEASLLYAETDESRRRREATAAQRRVEAHARRAPAGKPSKRERRQLLRLSGDRVR